MSNQNLGDYTARLFPKEKMENILAQRDVWTPFLDWLPQ